jgi:hypothetical protein
VAEEDKTDLFDLVVLGLSLSSTMDGPSLAAQVEKEALKHVNAKEAAAFKRGGLGGQIKLRQHKS